MRRSNLVAVVAAALLCCGCSLFAAGGRRSYQTSDGPPRCNPGPALFADIVGLVLTLPFAISSAADGREPGGNAEASLARGVETLTFIIALPYVVAVPMGGYNSYRCRAAKRRWGALTAEEQLEVNRQNERKRELPARLARETGAAVTFRGNIVLLKTDAASGTCLGLGWTDALRAAEPELRAVGIEDGVCMAGKFAVWAGRIDQLPTSVEGTRCHDHQGELPPACVAR